MPRATRKDVAKLAGVSVATVSHILNGRGEELGFSPDTALRVKAAAKQVGYIAHPSARNFRYQKSQVIALFTTEVPSSLKLPVFNELLTVVIDRALRAGYFVLPVPITADPYETMESTLREVHLAGAIIRDDLALRNAAPLLELNEIPSVWINTGLSAPPSPDLTTIVIDEKPGVAQVIAAIKPDGLRQVIVRGPGKASGRSEEFFRHFPQAQEVVLPGWLYRDGYDAGEHVLSLNPNLIFATNDYIAHGLLQFFRERGIDITPHFQLFGFGDAEQDPTPPHQLTTVTWPLPEAAALAADVLIEHLKDGKPLVKGVQRILPTTARLRETTVSR
ncbi:LacI family DNA-binding transcriptional regulator [Trueperella pecoris]|uniref:LacI family DNA-binding transcriptional regulator n=1 Tax=Trueperella pecoris TaxID=2733571 RepID=A0A7M1QVW2_9ACTO|nr:LacI family DNA-binding transcriptional regulator [Trueperella pecoris]QOQ39421.1 LacI family DNA-binding transcriptional regulator [Trueperella pecoris]QOR45961.1 LacI family DNA-binding transcriptional regulator [Trueperella pecoris]